MHALNYLRIRGIVLLVRIQQTLGVVVDVCAGIKDVGVQRITAPKAPFYETSEVVVYGVD